MKIEDIMSTNLVTVGMDDTLKTVKEVFDNTHFHHILVVESDTLLGIISDRDVLKSISPYVGTPAETSRDIATLNKRAHQIMTRKLVTISAHVDIKEAIRIFTTHKISCIPVIIGANKPVGIISWRDVIKAIAAQK
ncbi:MAG TPA: CBS domain-containing protein [Gammaproteobacteria bacterium]